jgi:dimethylaniline monooxygenase (N-oxide forming)
MTQLRPGERVAVIGAGSSGIASCQVLQARGIPFACFEKGSWIGGNWKYLNDNGDSSAYRSLHINTSRDLMGYATFPMPKHYPEYPDHVLIDRYFNDYVDHFGLRDCIRFRTEVIKVAPADDGWNVTTRDGDGAQNTDRYGAVVVANGHHWDPRWPEPPFPGQDHFAGEQLHAHHYKTPDILEGKRVLVLGIGNSACDIAVESSRVADRTVLAMRRGAYVVPKFALGRPIDEMNTPFMSRLPLPLQRLGYSALLRMVQGKMTKYGLPKPDHKLLGAHATVSSDLLPRIGHGDITVKPNIERFDRRRVSFVDGTVEEIDVVIFCTGYKITFPFFDPGLIASKDNHIPLFRRVMSPEHPGLYFVGLLQPLGAIMPLAEAQSEWVADVLEGKVRLPSPEAMRRVIDREDRRMAKRYVASKRHTIQVDFYPYLRTIRRERRRTAKRRGSLIAGRSHELRLGRTG